MSHHSDSRHNTEIQHSILLHNSIDHVGVAVVDLTMGTEVGAATLEGERLGTVMTIEDIPLGHKVAMRDVPAGREVVKYGRSIGRATQDIARGAWVHTHNLMTMRWSL